MPFVKLDCGILTSTLWMDRVAREVFITALLMAEPAEFDAPVPEISTRTLDYTGWEAPAGWYGFVPAASVAIIRHAGIMDDSGMEALERLASSDENSRSHEHEGRRMIRVNGGFLVLNYMKYRDRDYTGAERQRRYRKRQSERNAVTTSSNTVTSRVVTQAEAEEELDIREDRKKILRPQEAAHAAELASIKSIFPKRGGSQPWTRAERAINARLTSGATWHELLEGTHRYSRFCAATGKVGTEYVMQAATFFGPERRYLEPWTLPATKADNRLTANLSAAEEFMRRTEHAAA